MKIAKVKSKVLDEALKNYEEFPALHMYIAGFAGYERTSDGCFVSKIVKDYDGKSVLEMRLSLEDYFFNEQPESNTLWAFASKIIGKKEIDLKVLNIVSL